MSGDVSLLDRPAWLVEHLVQVPAIVSHLHQALVPSLQGRQEAPVSGSTERARLPIQLGAFDDADHLWAMLWSLIDDVTERTRVCMWPGIRRRQNMHNAAGVQVVRGYRSLDQHVIEADTRQVVGWLLDRVFMIATDSHYTDTVDMLVDEIRRLQGVAGLIPFRAYRPYPCSECRRYALLPEWNESGNGVAAIVCEACETRYEEGA